MLPSAAHEDKPGVQFSTITKSLSTPVVKRIKGGVAMGTHSGLLQAIKSTQALNSTHIQKGTENRADCADAGSLRAPLSCHSQRERTIPMSCRCSAGARGLDSIWLRAASGALSQCNRQGRGVVKICGITFIFGCGGGLFICVGCSLLFFMVLEIPSSTHE